MRGFGLVAGTVLVGGVGAVAYAVRQEMWRYLLIRRAAYNPDAVGRSVTPQGNMVALGKTGAGPARRTRG